MMKIGISTNCECGDTLEEALGNIKAAGFEDVMLSEHSGELESSLKIIRAVGLNVPYVHLAYRLPFGKNVNDFWTMGNANRELVADFIKRLEICKRFGAEIAVMHTTNYPAGRDRSSWSVEQGVNSMREIVDAADKIGIVVAVENQSPMDNFYMRHVLDAINSSSLGFCYDCGHHYLLTSGEDLLGAYGDRLVALHLHDNLMDATNMETWERDIHLLPFDGKIDFERVMRDIAGCGYKGIIMLELHKQIFESEKKYENLSSIEYLREAKVRGEKLVQMLVKYKRE